jgi:uncharacterized protein
VQSLSISPLNENAGALDLMPAHLKIVFDILQKHAPPAEVFAFGSRVSGCARKYSNLDLAVTLPDPLSFRTLRQLKDAFEDFDLPTCLDIVDWTQADPDFNRLVSTQKTIKLQAPENATNAV